jgi:hypothetical protein
VWVSLVVLTTVRVVIVTVGLGGRDVCVSLVTLDVVDPLGCVFTTEVLVELVSLEVLLTVEVVVVAVSPRVMNCGEGSPWRTTAPPCRMSTPMANLPG